ncbi:PIG-L deacetylase family protein [Nigerium massiliense]|uniref:PIG-L deacetylase family protein n=1 Tax=Nigerium massiliense TaxID=1522317 RepID=UPI00058B6A51|nr:PIG-L deacetylase family protein [Nigerium massiliense]
MAELAELEWRSWKRVLVVVAHPDDAEYGLSAAVHAWSRAGVAVHYLLLTHGEAGIATMTPEQTAPARRAEQQAACDAAGVVSLTFLDHPDGMLVGGLDLRRDIAREIRRIRPDAVVTANFDVEAYGSFNQADHRVAGLAAIDATRDAANGWVFRELAEFEGLPAWSATSILVAGAAEPTHGVEVGTDDERAGIESLSSHRVYLEALPDHPKPDDFIPMLLAGGGRALGVQRAVAFRVLPA